MAREYTRREGLRLGALAVGSTVAGCVGARKSDRIFAESFETGMDDWETAASIGPEEPISAFEWRIERSRARAAEGDWSLEVSTEGDHDDGTAWATRELAPPPDAETFEVAVGAWSESESFNTLRHLVLALRSDPPADEGDFPDPGVNTTAVPAAPYGGLREPLHLAEGWREYAFRWEPEAVPARLFLSVGVSVVWEADATHYVDDVVVRVE